MLFTWYTFEENQGQLYEFHIVYQLWDLDLITNVLGTISKIIRISKTKARTLRKGQSDVWASEEVRRSWMM